MNFFISSDPPSITLRLGRSLRSEEIKEGDDVYFECSVRSNPPIKKLVWMHNVRNIRLNYTPSNSNIGHGRFLQGLSIRSKESVAGFSFEYN